MSATSICPKCTYERTLEDDEIFPDWQCPKCEIAYNKYKLKEEQPLIQKSISVTKGIKRNNTVKKAKPERKILPSIPKKRKKFIEKSLSKDEEIRELFDFNWVSKLPMYLFFTLGGSLILLLLIASIINGFSLDSAISLILPVLFIGIGFYEYFRLSSLEMGVTNKRLILKTGIISRRTEEMRLGAIETVELRQGIIERILNMGTVKVTGVGISNLVFRYLDDPLEVKKRIESIIRAIHVATIAISL